MWAVPFPRHQGAAVTLMDGDTGNRECDWGGQGCVLPPGRFRGAAWGPAHRLPSRLPQNSPNNISGISNPPGTPRDDGELGGNFLHSFQNDNVSECLLGDRETVPEVSRHGDGWAWHSGCLLDLSCAVCELLQDRKVGRRE